MEVAATCLHWSQPLVPQSPPSSQTLVSPASSHSSKRRNCGERAVVCRFVPLWERSALFGRMAPKIPRTRSFEIPKSRRGETIRRAASASFDDDTSSEEEFVNKIQELVLRFHIAGDGDDDDAAAAESVQRDKAGEISGSRGDFSRMESNFPSLQSSLRPFESAEPPWVRIRSEPPDWSEREEIIPANIERKANSVDLPFSLRILKKKKKQLEEGFREAGESAYCSVKKAFSSMVFIIRELQSYTLQMREVLFYEDLQGILVRVQKEMHASFVWLFQQIFSRTPTLMVYVMILLANFTVHSMGHNLAIAASPPPGSYAATAEAVSTVETHRVSKFDPLSIKSFSVTGKTASVGGGGGGGGKIRPVAGATDGGDGWLNRSSSRQHRTIFPDGMSPVGDRTVKEEEGISGSQLLREVKLWNSIVEEASRMQASLRDEALDSETMQRFVSPVKANMEPEDYTEYFKTELMYQHAMSQEPENPLLLSNYAQFLFLVVHDHDRAEEYFKRAVGVVPADAEALSRYASFLWLARRDMTAAEETYLEAIAADPGNTFYAANYANFLWNTGGEDTCFPLDGDTMSSGDT
ncbi:hypothetical protein H6P81_006847 [Aristolochia fimbriata]|uniref:Tetratricopeptide repeat-like superfamily protein n=1 Tax=Aristolochia fimbriata TaxID=158543 RepID=A0AAV7EYT9_ARIFI|nr:hypothetical protein H6P81_006847 [Aristolochia fimbriata]